MQGTPRVAVCNVDTQYVEWPIVGNSWFIESSLTADTRICLGDSDDTLRVVRAQEPAPVVCGNVTFGALDYGGKKLIVGGGNGRDVVIGGDGADVVDFFYSTTDRSLDRTSTGKGSDRIRSNRYGPTDAWGGTGDDVYASYGGVFNVRDIGGRNQYNGIPGAEEHFCGPQGSVGNLQCGGDAGDLQNLVFPAPAGCPFDLVGFCLAQAVVAPPGPGDQ